MPHTWPAATDSHSLETAFSAIFDETSSRDLVELPSHCVANHLNRLGEADVTHAAALHFALELLEREAGADLLLKRQSPDSCVLHPAYLDAVDTLAHRAQRNRQRIHREARIDASPENRHLGFPGRFVDALGHVPIRLLRIRRLLCRRDDRHAVLEHFQQLGKHALERRARAQHRDIGFRSL